MVARVGTSLSQPSPFNRDYTLGIFITLNGTELTRTPLGDVVNGNESADDGTNFDFTQYYPTTIGGPIYNYSWSPGSNTGGLSIEITKFDMWEGTSINTSSSFAKAYNYTDVSGNHANSSRTHIDCHSTITPDSTLFSNSSFGVRMQLLDKDGSIRNLSENSFFIIDLGETKLLSGIITQGRGDYNQWTSEYKVEYSLDNTNFTTTIPENLSENGMFIGNSNQHELVQSMLSARVSARYVKIIPKVGGGDGDHPTMRADVITSSLDSVTGYDIGDIITTDDFVEKLNTDLQTTITYVEDVDANGDMVSYLEFNDITGATTMDLTGIPLSIFDETHLPGQLTGEKDQPRNVTLTASENKLYFKYLTIPNDMTIISGDASALFNYELLGNLIPVDTYNGDDIMVLDYKDYKNEYFRKFKIYKSNVGIVLADRYINTTEIEVWMDVNGTLTNVTQTTDYGTWTPSESSSLDAGGYPISRLINGNREDFIHTKNNTNEWVMIETNQDIKLSDVYSVFVFNRQYNTHRAYGMQFQFLDSNDNIVASLNGVQETQSNGGNGINHYNLSYSNDVSVSVINSGATFTHKFIHQLESDLSLDIALNAYSDPDTLVVDIPPDQPAALVFGYDLRNGPTDIIQDGVLIFDGNMSSNYISNGWTTDITQKPLHELIQL